MAAQVHRTNGCCAGCLWNGCVMTRMFRSVKNLPRGGLAHRRADELADLYHHWSTSDDEAEAERNRAAKHRSDYIVRFRSVCRQGRFASRPLPA